MEGQTPTPNEESELNSFIFVEVNNQNFSIDIEIKDNFFIISITVLNKVIETFQIGKNLEDWKKAHYIFNCFQKLEQIREFFLNGFNKKDISIKYENNKLSININIVILYKKETISIELDKKEINKDEIINKLYEIIKKIKTKENSDKNINYLNEIIEKQNIEINSLKKEIELINYNFKELKTSCEILEECNLYGSSIISKKEEIDLLKETIKTKLKKEVKYFKKLYRASTDGEDASTFHKLCDNIENTLSFVKTGGHRRFGGFTTQTWNQVNSFTKTDENAFVFSLDKLKIYPYTNNGRAIRCDNNYLPTFGVGTCDFRLYNKPLSDVNLYTNQVSGDRSYNYNGDANALSENGNGNCIKTIEVEVYQVIF